MTPTGELYEFGRYRLDASARSLFRDGQPVLLAPKEIDTLIALVRAQGRVVNREQLLREVWPDTFVEDGGLSRNISVLRKTLQEGHPRQTFIETLSKRGYRFTGPVRPLAAAIRQPDDPGPAIAVFPFSMPGGDDALLAAGVADALVARLSRVPGILVRPMTAVLRYAGSPDDSGAVRSQLQVTLVLRGSIRRDRDQVRVAAQLVNLDREAVLWAETFSAPFTDLFSVEDALATQVAEAVLPRVRGLVSLAPSRPINPAAYDAYVRGRHAWNRAKEAYFKLALDEYSAAIAIDPAFAEAHVGIAECFNLMGFWWVMPPRSAFPQAEAAARRALELDPSLGEAHVALAWARLHYHYDRRGAEALFKRALELSPGYVLAHQYYALFFAQQGRFDRAFEEIRAALSIDPRSLTANYNLGVFYMLSRQYDEAIAQFQRSMSIDATYLMLHAHSSLSYALKGMAHEAWAAHAAAAPFNHPVLQIINEALIHAMLGNRQAALNSLDRFFACPDKPYVLPLMIGQVYAALGDPDEALPWMEKDYEERDNWLMWVKVNPCFDPIRDDERFQALLRRIGLQP